MSPEDLKAEEEADAEADTEGEDLAEDPSKLTLLSFLEEGGVWSPLDDPWNALCPDADADAAAVGLLVAECWLMSTVREVILLLPSPVLLPMPSRPLVRLTGMLFLSASALSESSSSELWMRTMPLTSSSSSSSSSSLYFDCGKADFFSGWSDKIR